MLEDFFNRTIDAMLENFSAKTIPLFILGLLGLSLFVLLFVAMSVVVTGLIWGTP